MKVAVRTVDLQDPVAPLTDITDYDRVRVYVLAAGRLLGFADLSNHRQPLSAARLREGLVDALGMRLLDHSQVDGAGALWIEALEALSRRLLPDGDDGKPQEEATLDPSVSVSVVVATRDRPNDLRECLRSLRAQETPRRVELVVVDNNPATRATAQVVSDFDDVVLVEERRPGSSYARNAGILASSGELIVVIDDDVTAPPDWLEKLSSPFARTDVAAVTGNILPFELETHAQRMFEVYGGLGRGFERREATPRWFERFKVAVPTWWLGGTANAAFRAWIFSDARIGLMREELGAGMPAAVGEDTYLFYRILKAGYTLIYEPDAFVWHRHRPDIAALRRQLYGYSKGHVAYHLTTLLRDHDLRALAYLGLRLPRAQARRILGRVRGRSDYPLSFTIMEILGNLVGPIALWQSWQTVKRQGRSTRGQLVTG